MKAAIAQKEEGVGPIEGLTTDDDYRSRYRIVRRLGQGGFGEVFEVQHRTLPLRRALKVLFRSAGDREQFLRDTRPLSTICSPHVVQIIDAGVARSTGRAWLVMELLQGHNLSDYVKKRGRCTPREVGLILRQIGQALGDIHCCGIVHRDLKPSNIFVCRGVSNGEILVKVIDFGISVEVDRDRTAASTDGCAGSPPWMAPEQILGKEVSFRTDVWAFGLVAYWLITGLKYWGCAEQSDDNEALYDEILNGSIVSPSVRVAAARREAPLPAGFDAWFLKCLSRNPRDRFLNGTQATLHLKPILERLAVWRPERAVLVSRAPKQPIESATVSTWSSSTWSARQWILLGLIGLLVIASLSLAAYLLWRPVAI